MSEERERPDRVEIHVFHHWPKRPLKVKLDGPVEIAGDLDIAISEAIRVEIEGNVPTSLSLKPRTQTLQGDDNG